MFPSCTTSDANYDELFQKGQRAHTDTVGHTDTHAHVRIPEAWCTHMNTRRRNSRACSSGTAAADAKAIWPKRQLSHLVNTVCASENETAFSDLYCLLLVFSDVFAEHYCYCFLLPNHRRNFLERVSIGQTKKKKSVIVKEGRDSCALIQLLGSFTDACSFCLVLPPLLRYPLYPVCRYAHLKRWTDSLHLPKDGRPASDHCLKTTVTFFLCPMSILSLLLRICLFSCLSVSLI